MLLLCGLWHTAAIVYGSERNAQSSQSWGYEPVFDFAPSAPQYQFHTTSAFISASGESNMMKGNNGLRGTSPWDDEDPGGPAIGEVEDNQPIGDTPWLLMFLLSAGYIAFRARSRKDERENG